MLAITPPLFSCSATPLPSHLSLSRGSSTGQATNEARFRGGGGANGALAGSAGVCVGCHVPPHRHEEQRPPERRPPGVAGMEWKTNQAIRSVGLQPYRTGCTFTSREMVSGIPQAWHSVACFFSCLMIARSRAWLFFCDRIRLLRHQHLLCWVPAVGKRNDFETCLLK